MNARESSKFRETAGLTAGIILILLAGLLLLLGCSTQTKQKWLTRFFDGVPVPGQTNAARIEYDEDGRPLATVVAYTNVFGFAAAPKFTAHPPYEDKQCGECHESKFSVRLKGSQKDVCFACHDDFLAKPKFKHQPADNGDCVSCHDAHGSPHPKMVKFDGVALCNECHDPFPKTAKSIHQPATNGNCASCHSAHASDHKGLLIKPDGKLCFECHDDFQQKLTTAAFKHSPVENNECASCHSPHFAGEKGLLVKESRQLCFDCHEEKDMAAVKGHAGDFQKSCVECHDPHFGKDKLYLTPEAAKNSAAQPAPTTK